MHHRLLIIFLACITAVCLIAALKCNDLEIECESTGQGCTSCYQWALGSVSKPTSDSGWLCLYICATHSYNICDQSIVLWVGSDWEDNCFNAPSGVSEINWYFESSREDWQDSSGSWAEIFMFVPCFNCSVNNVTPTWYSSCMYCEGCE